MLNNQSIKITINEFVCINVALGLVHLYKGYFALSMQESSE